jgi:hypothetical protein
VPKVGGTFEIMNFSSKIGAFSKVDGLAINSSEHFSLTYQSADVLLTVVSGALPAASIGIRYFTRPSLKGLGYSNGESSAVDFGFRNEPFPPRLGLTSRSNRFPTSLTTGLGWEASDGAKPNYLDVLARQAVMNFKAATTPRAFPDGFRAREFLGYFRAGAGNRAFSRLSPRTPASRRTGNALGPNSVEYHLDVLSALGTGMKHLLGNRSSQPRSADASHIGYWTFGTPR